MSRDDPKLRTRSGGAFHGAPNERRTLSRCANERCTAHIIAEKPEPTYGTTEVEVLLSFLIMSSLLRDAVV